ncbi:hypothetical protein KY308_00275 [Candidatus Woesearchaeota archaeon]|nr:hypothetical protein [Candidatus Woesearchaeota archaeon]
MAVFLFGNLHKMVRRPGSFAVRAGIIEDYHPETRVIIYEVGEVAKALADDKKHLEEKVMEKKTSWGGVDTLVNGFLIPLSEEFDEGKKYRNFIENRQR